MGLDTPSAESAPKVIEIKDLASLKEALDNPELVSKLTQEIASKGDTPKGEALAGKLVKILDSLTDPTTRDEFQMDASNAAMVTALISMARTHQIWINLLAEEPEVPDVQAVKPEKAAPVVPSTPAAAATPTAQPAPAAKVDTPLEKPAKPERLADVSYQARKQYIDSLVAAGKFEDILLELHFGETLETATKTNITDLQANMSLEELYGPHVKAIVRYIEKLPVSQKPDDKAMYYRNRLIYSLMVGHIRDFYKHFGTGTLVTAFVGYFESSSSPEDGFMNALQLRGVHAEDIENELAALLDHLDGNASGIANELQNLLDTNTSSYASFLSKFIRFAFFVGRTNSEVANTMIERAKTKPGLLKEAQAILLGLPLKALSYSKLDAAIREIETARIQAELREKTERAKAIADTYLTNKDGIGDRIIFANGEIKFGFYKAPTDKTPELIGTSGGRYHLDFAPGDPLFELVGGNEAKLRDVMRARTQAMAMKLIERQSRNTGNDFKAEAEGYLAQELSNMLWSYGRALEVAVAGNSLKTTSLDLGNVNSPDTVGHLIALARLRSEKYTAPLQVKLQLKEKVYLPGDINPSPEEIKQANDLLEIIDPAIPKLTADTIHNAELPSQLAVAAEHMLLNPDGKTREYVKAEEVAEKAKEKVAHVWDHGLVDYTANQRNGTVYRISSTVKKNYIDALTVEKNTKRKAELQKKINAIEVFRGDLQSYQDKYAAEFPMNAPPVVPRVFNKERPQAALNEYNRIMGILRPSYPQVTDLASALKSLTDEVNALVAERDKLQIPQNTMTLRDAKDEVKRSLARMREEVTIRLEVPIGGDKKVTGIEVPLSDIITSPYALPDLQFEDFDELTANFNALVDEQSRNYVDRLRAYSERVVEAILKRNGDELLLFRSFGLTKEDIKKLADNQEAWDNLVMAFILGRTSNSLDSIDKFIYNSTPQPLRNVTRAVAVFAHSLRNSSHTMNYKKIDDWVGGNYEDRQTIISSVQAMQQNYQQSSISNRTILEEAA